MFTSKCYFLNSFPVASKRKTTCPLRQALCRSLQLEFRLGAQCLFGLCLKGVPRGIFCFVGNVGVDRGAAFWRKYPQNGFAAN